MRSSMLSLDFKDRANLATPVGAGLTFSNGEVILNSSALLTLLPQISHLAARHSQAAATSRPTAAAGWPQSALQPPAACWPPARNLAELDYAFVQR